MVLRVLDKKALREKGVSYSKVHLLRLEKQGIFPKRFNLTENRVGWLEEDVDRWIKERVMASSQRQAEVRPALTGGGHVRPAT